MSNYFPYGQLEMDTLISADPILGEVIKQVGFIPRTISPNPFLSIVRNIIGQQISTKAAVTVFARFSEAIGEVTPQNIYFADAEHLRSCGISHRKIANLKEISRRVLEHELELDKIPQMTDPEAIHYLSQLPGVGVWTAEMLLLFTYQRPDIVSYGDLIIKRGMERIYGIEKITKKEFLQIRTSYHPFGSIASFYLWHIGNLPIYEPLSPTKNPSS